MPILSQKSYNRFFLLFIPIYISTLAASTITGIQQLKALTNIAAVVAITYSALCIFFPSAHIRIQKKSFFLLLVIILFFCTHLTLNYERTDPIDCLKIFSLFVFSFLGIGLKWRRFIIPKKTLILMAALPLIAEISIRLKSQHTGVEFGFFPNKNTAVMYYAILLAIILTQLSKSRSHPYLFVFISLAFQKLGAILSSSAAVLLVYRNKTIKLLPIIILTATPIAVLLFYVGALDRVIEVITGLYRLLKINNLNEISRMDYGAIAYELGSSDLSAVFRIKHWSEILDYYFSQDIATILFGYGARQTLTLTSAGLMPHSDIIRLLCEMGMLILISYIYVFYLLLKRQRDKYMTIALTIVFFYYFSENLIDNFISMYLIHVIAGTKSHEISHG